MSLCPCPPDSSGDLLMRQQTKDNDQGGVNEQIELATQLHAEDARRVEAAKERLAATEAAEEMGIPAAYMERAADELAARRRSRAVQRKRRSAGGIIALVIAFAGTSLWHQAHEPSPHLSPLVYDFAVSNQGMWHLGQPNGSPPDGQASLSFPVEQGHPVAVVKINHFYQGSDQYNAVDLITNQVPRPLTGFKTVSFRVRSTGLSQIRLFLQNGNERWCSPFLTASGGWHEVRVPLKQFLHQAVSPQYNPQDEPYVAPTTVGMISFKLGRDANPPDEHGEVAIDDLQFE